MILLARLAHTAWLRMDEVETLLFTPYQAGLHGVPISNIASMSTLSFPRSDHRRFLLALHAMFLDFHLFWVFHRDVSAVAKFRRTLLEHDVWLKDHFREYWADDSGSAEKTRVTYLTDWASSQESLAL